MFFFVTRGVRMFSDETWKIIWVSIMANIAFVLGMGLVAKMLGK